MSPAATLGTVLLAYLPAAITPGPNFVLIAHTAATGTRRAAVAIALGVVAAGGLLAAVAVFGLGGVLARTPWLATALRVACGGYLAWLGVRLWWQARTPGAPVPPPDQDEVVARRGTAFRRGVVSNVTNPKAAAFFGSVLTATLPPTEPTAVRAAAVALIVATSAAWHLSVALLFSSPATQRWYARAEPALNRVVGTVLVVLGVTLASTP
ncbi:LysE family transporter [Amycolatopsis sp. DG1A-15b]|uniref:LysE family translocator n=1 Tax=Amycolatopsis sp. DG1A-15b TaxID=3052846 RepID=UPI00255B94F3|nr:LysE family transporter [Amycolatopsis sp. DG1A-15b]WIX90130.1 LysE family transporter [Amycolatopsis sp. DG1A-15b]